MFIDQCLDFVFNEENYIIKKKLMTALLFVRSCCSRWSHIFDLALSFKLDAPPDATLPGICACSRGFVPPPSLVPGIFHVEGMC